MTKSSQSERLSERARQEVLCSLLLVCVKVIESRRSLQFSSVSLDKWESEPARSGSYLTDMTIIIAAAIMEMSSGDSVELQPEE